MTFQSITKHRHGERSDVCIFAKRAKFRNLKRIDATNSGFLSKNTPPQPNDSALRQYYGDFSPWL